MWIAIYDGFHQTRGLATSLLGLGLAVVLWRYTPEVQVDLVWFVVSIVFFVITTFALLGACRILSQKKRLPLPSVKAHRKSFKPFTDESEGILLVESSELFTFNSEVSISIEDNDYEVPLGSGYVLNVQQNGLIQILITEVFEDGAEGTSWEDVKANKSSALTQLMVRPSKTLAIQSP